MSRYYKGPENDHFDGKEFFNPWFPFPLSMFDLLRWRMTAKPAPWPKHLENVMSDRPPDKIEGSDLRVSFVGHDTVLIQTQGLNILTDPIWSLRASPVSWAGPKRVSAPGIPFDRLPKIDLVLISHCHYDHLDLPTIQRLWSRDKPLIVTPLGNDAIIQLHDPSIRVETLDWHQWKAVNHQCAIHLEPLQHWSARTLWDRNHALWGAFVLITPSGTLYFAADTGYAGGIFREARQKFGPFRLALLPIGAYKPRWFMHYGHMGPEEAVLAHQDLGGPYTMGIHFGTFHLSDESYEDPLQELDRSRRKHSVDEQRFRALRIGEAWDIP